LRGPTYSNEPFFRNALRSHFAVDVPTGSRLLYGTDAYQSRGYSLAQEPDLASVQSGAKTVPTTAPHHSGSG